MTQTFSLAVYMSFKKKKILLSFVRALRPVIITHMALGASGWLMVLGLS